MNKLQKIAAVASTCFVMFAAGCNGQPDGTAASPTPAADAAVPANTPAHRDAMAPNGPAIDSPIGPDDLGLIFRVVDGPYYDKTADRVSFDMEAENTGTVVLSSTGRFPVNIGLIIVGPDGLVDTPPGNLEFQRLHFNEALASGAKAEFRAEFPAAPTIGGSVVIDGVQEGVNWFRSYGKQTLTLGTFARCQGDANSLCNESGKAIEPVH